MLSPCLFNLYAEHIMRNARLGEFQAGMKIGGRNINNLRYVDDTTLMAEIKEELKSLLMKVKEVGERAGLRLNIKKKKTWTWANSRRWWGTGRPGVLQSMGSQKVRPDWATEQQQQHSIVTYVPHLLSPLICQWTSRLLSCPSYCKYCCSDHRGTCAF